MYPKFLTLTFLLINSISLLAMDLNSSKIIIEEATQATVELQDKFAALTQEEEITSPIKEETFIEENITITNEQHEMTPLIDEEALIEKNITKIPEVPEISESNISILSKPLKEPICEEKNIIDNNTTTELEKVEGSTMRGMILFKTRFKNICKQSGEEFANHYTQEDWDDIYEADEFKKVVLELCPEMENRYKDKWTPHLYKFSTDYASDSDNIPEC